MTHRHFKYEGWLYLLAFLIALGTRTVQLGDMPLNDVEAESALQALQISQSENPALNPHPFYILSTSILFYSMVAEQIFSRASFLLLLEAYLSSRLFSLTTA
ncbi:MAG: hypothetical protein HC797_02430, partial [Anaerolineales bacterium]|nr:hypothetical protein [Anaerolineales bacterium]